MQGGDYNSYGGNRQGDYQDGGHYDSYQGGYERDRGYGGDRQQYQGGMESNTYRDTSYRGGGGYDRYQQQQDYYRNDRDDYNSRPPRYQDRTFDRDRPRDRDSRPNIRKRHGDFYCSVCGELNFASRDSCRMCGKRKDQDLGVDSKKSDFKPGDWKCISCETHNFASRKNCFKCNEPNKNLPEDEGDFQDGDWRCFDCGAHNQSNKDQCTKCGREKTKRRDGDIDCPNCGKLNFSFRATCFQCKTSLNNPNANEKPSGFRERERERDRSRGRHRDDFKSGDWNCRNCDFHNFASRQVCKDCGVRR